MSRRTVAEDIVREGEINILGGLLSSQETKLKNGVPGLMDIPILGRLFTTEKLDTSRGELLIVLVPHIVRMPDFSETNLRGVAAGNDQNVRLNFAPKVETVPVVPPPAPAAETAPATPAQPAASPALTFNVPSAQTQLNSPVTISLQLENVNDLLTAPLKDQIRS